MIWFDKYEDPETLKVEMAERKGIGHPDSLADGMAEEISRSLSKRYLDEFGEILHHNTDKLEVVGGEADVWFGGGEMKRPIHVLLSGRASKVDQFDIHEVAKESARNYLKSVLSNYSTSWFEVESYIGEGSPDLRKNFKTLMSNDTSFGTGFWPFTKLEQSVFDLEHFVQSLRKKMPAIGEDIKVMGVRQGENFDFTIAVAFVSKYVESAKDYASLKEELIREIKESGVLPSDSRVLINSADSSSPYITNIGTSAESGDDGAVGRGNRAYGLITPMRHMSLEATAGKNPITHVGKLYNALAIRISRRVFEEAGSPCAVEIVSRIGSPITEPTSLALRMESPNTMAKKIAEEELEALPEMWKDFLKGRINVF